MMLPPNYHRIWLLDLAKILHPTTQLDGFDIDIADCPPKEWLPPNVQMHQLDIFEEIPQHLVGIYDIIQLRLFQVVVRDNDPVPLLKNVLKMLSRSLASSPSRFHVHLDRSKEYPVFSSKRVFPINSPRNLT